jgi:hypothetical protein
MDASVYFADHAYRTSSMRDSVKHARYTVRQCSLFGAS